MWIAPVGKKLTITISGDNVRPLEFPSAPNIFNTHAAQGAAKFALQEFAHCTLIHIDP